MTLTAPRVQLRYGDKVLDSGSGGVHRHLNPYTGQVQAEIPPERRRDVLMRFAALLDEHRAEFAALQALDGGTPTHFGQRIIDNSVNWTRYYAGWCDKLSGELISTLDTRGYFSYTTPEPYGVIGAIVTWNGPVVSLGMKVIPALAAGNCVVTKPSEFTPFAPDLYGRLLRQAGVPAGVCSILAGGPEAGAALVRNPTVEKVSFTGGPAAARQIAHVCAEQLKPAVLELGGKTGSIVFPDAGDLTTPGESRSAAGGPGATWRTRTSSSRRSSSTPTRATRSRRPRSSARCCWCSSSRPRTRRSSWPTARPTGSARTSSRPT
jgi:aldehyde dehydrogenase (NAD+)